MKRNIILTLALLGYLTYIIKYLKALPYIPTPELLLKIIIWIFVAIIITAKLFTGANTNKTKPKVQKAKKSYKHKRTRVITPFDKKFKKNFAKTNKKYKNEVQVPDLKTAYIESAWEELKKN